MEYSLPALDGHLGSQSDNSKIEKGILLKKKKKIPEYIVIYFVTLYIKINFISK